MSTAQTLEIYNILKKHFQNEKDASLVVADLETILEKKIEDKKQDLATKQDLAEFKLDIFSKIESSKSETLRWLSLFWIGQMAAVIGILFTFLNLYFKK